MNTFFSITTKFITRRILVIAAITSILLMMIIFSFMFNVHASSISKDNGSHIKCYKSIEIPNHATLWSIATEYINTEHDNIHSFMKEIKSINNLKSNTIIAGEYLIIPYYMQQ